MEFTPLVPLRLPARVLAFARAELAEVFGGARRDVCEELHFYAAEGFAFRCVSTTHNCSIPRGVKLGVWHRARGVNGYRIFRIAVYC